VLNIPVQQGKKIIKNQYKNWEGTNKTVLILFLIDT
jgi:hypothetical protein